MAAQQQKGGAAAKPAGGPTRAAAGPKKGKPKERPPPPPPEPANDDDTNTLYQIDRCAIYLRCWIDLTGMRFAWLSSRCTVHVRYFEQDVHLLRREERVVHRGGSRSALLEELSHAETLLLLQTGVTFWSNPTLTHSHCCLHDVGVGCALTCTCVFQVVEIAGYTDHLLSECEQKSEFKSCPRCSEAVPNAEYHQHVPEETCKRAHPLTIPHTVTLHIRYTLSCFVSASESDKNRCPLCHENISSGENGWKTHLMSASGCKQNPRRQAALDRQGTSANTHYTVNCIDELHVHHRVS